MQSTVGLTTTLFGMKGFHTYAYWSGCVDGCVGRWAGCPNLGILRSHSAFALTVGAKFPRLSPGRLLTAICNPQVQNLRQLIFSTLVCGGQYLCMYLWSGWE